MRKVKSHDTEGTGMQAKLLDKSEIATAFFSLVLSTQYNYLQCCECPCPIKASAAKQTCFRAGS